MEWGLWHYAGDRDQDQMQKSKMAVWGGLTNSYEKKRSENQREKERYKHLNAEFQRIARRDKKIKFRNSQKTNPISIRMIIMKNPLGFTLYEVSCF